MKKIIAIISLAVLLAGAVGYIVYDKYTDDFRYVSYIQDKDEVYNMACGIIQNCRAIRDGVEDLITYDFNDPEYAELLDKYDLVNMAGDGSEFDKALRLMDNFSGRLKHNGNFSEYTADMDAVYLLDYALDKPEHGIHCRAKAQIMNEEYLALGIYSRKLWLNPLSVYDGECHVVNEIWDSGYQKWIMLDTTNDIYWIGEERIPLSAIEVRDKMAAQEFVTAVMPGEKTEDLLQLRDKHMDLILYTAKNMAYLQYFLNYGRGEEAMVYAMLPENMEPFDGCLISEDTIKEMPVYIAQ